jgi:hypothetical protein
MAIELHDAVERRWLASYGHSHRSLLGLFQASLNAKENGCDANVQREPKRGKQEKTA